MVSWTPENDAKLLVGIFEFMEIKASSALLQHLAKKIGEDCTPKAVSHRLNNLKKFGKGTAPSGSANTSTPSAQAAKTSAAAKRGHGSVTKNSIANAKANTLFSDEKEDGYDGMQSSSPNKGKKRGRPANGASKKKGNDGDVDEDVEVIKKKIKREPSPYNDFPALFGGPGHNVGSDDEEI